LDLRAGRGTISISRAIRTPWERRTRLADTVLLAARSLSIPHRSKFNSGVRVAGGRKRVTPMAEIPAREHEPDCLLGLKMSAFIAVLVWLSIEMHVINADNRKACEEW